MNQDSYGTVRVRKGQALIQEAEGQLHDSLVLLRACSDTLGLTWDKLCQFKKTSQQSRGALLADAQGKFEDAREKLLKSQSSADAAASNLSAALGIVDEIRRICGSNIPKSLGDSLDDILFRADVVRKVLRGESLDGVAFRCEALRKELQTFPHNFIKHSVEVSFAGLEPLLDPRQLLKNPSPAQS